MLAIISLLTPLTGGLAASLDRAELASRRAQAARQEAQLERAAFDEAPIGGALTSPDGRYTRVNRALCAMTGYSAELLIGMHFADITHPDDREQGLASRPSRTAAPCWRSACRTRRTTRFRSLASAARARRCWPASRRTGGGRWPSRATPLLEHREMLDAYGTDVRCSDVRLLLVCLRRSRPGVPRRRSGRRRMRRSRIGRRRTGLRSLVGR